MITPRSELGCAVRITTVGAVVASYLAADCVTLDTATGAFYAPDLFDISDMAGSIPDPLTPIASVTSCGITLANRAGRWYAALNAGVTFDAARVEVWRTHDQEFDSSSPPYWRGTVDSEGYDLGDDVFKITARGPMAQLDGVQLPTRIIDDTTFPNAPSRNKGRVLPMRWGSWLQAGRFSEYLCVDVTGATEIRVMDTLCPDGSKIKMAASYGTPDHPGLSGSPFPNLDGLAWLIDASKFDATKLRQMASHWNPDRRTLAHETTSARAEQDASFALGGVTSGATGLVSIRVAPPPEDTPDPVTEDPCATVTVTEDPEDPTVQEQCPTVPPRKPHDSWGGLRAGHFPGEADTGDPDYDPEADMILGYHGGYIGYNPDGPSGHNNVASFGGILWEQARFAGIQALLDAPTFFHPSEWTSGTQAGLTFRNSPQLEEQYNLTDLWAAGCVENRALLAERAGLISLRSFDPLGSPSSVVYAITPRVVSEAGTSIVPGRWGQFANEVVFVAYGDGMDPTQNPRTSVRSRNQDSIDQRAAAGLPPIVTYTVGEEQDRKHGLWLDGIDRDSFRAVAQGLVAFLSARQTVYEVTLQPPVEEADAVMAIELGDHVSMVWPYGDPDLGDARTGSPFIDEDSPAIGLVIGRAPDLMNHTMKIRVVRLIGPPDGTPACEVYGSYMAGDEVFPPELGGGSMLPFNPEWTAEQQSEALCSGGYYGRSKYR